jgi:uncharacterized protein YecE (DUF72 family)
MKIIVGTSGWLYKHWGEKFYPAKTKDREKLDYLAGHFDTVEINASFYRMPTGKVFKGWHDKAEEKFKKFLYTVKLNRYITHRKKLILDETSKPFLRDFIKNSRNLGRHLGGLLIQLPPQFTANNERLEEFLKFLTAYNKRMKYNADLAVEFRHETWLQEETYEILRKYKTAFVIADSSVWPKARVITADFSYIRLHGPTWLFASSYSKEQLDEWKDFMFSQKKVKKFYVYFNNDQSAYAIDNAKYLKQITAKK